MSFPLMLAWRLKDLGALQDFEPYPMVLKAARYLIERGPVTPQERWEENSGYSPSTLAANIAALICAADFARIHHDVQSALFLEEYADFLESHVESWTVTTQGSLVPAIFCHFIRIQPVDPQDPQPVEDPNLGIVRVRNRPPGEPFEFPAKEIVDAGFLELVRYGIRKARDPLIEDSLQVIDAVLKVETPLGPCWRRYNYDGHGQREDGGAYNGWGKGRAWPLLTGERAHYEFAAGRKVKHLICAIEGFASKGGMIPEQVWDEADRPDVGLYFGKPTGSAMPLIWAHAEYMNLLRSVWDEAVFERIPAVAERYLNGRGRKDLEVWKFNRQVRTVVAGDTLRIQAHSAFRLRWTLDEWATLKDTDALSTAIDIHYLDLVSRN